MKELEACKLGNLDRYARLSDTDDTDDVNLDFTLYDDMIRMIYYIFFFSPPYEENLGYFNNLDF